MAAPSIGNLNIVDSCDGSGALTLAAVAGATDAFPGAFANFGITPVIETGQTLSNNEVSVSPGNRYSAWNAFSGGPYDISGAQQWMCAHIRGTSTGFTYADGSDPGAVQFHLFSGGGTTNYATWNVGNASTTGWYGSGAWHLFATTEAPDATGGSWDNTDVTGWGISLLSAASGSYNFEISVDQIVYIDGPLEVLGGEVGDPASLAWLLNELRTGNNPAFLLDSIGVAYQAKCPLAFRADYWPASSAPSLLAFKDDDTTGGAGVYRVASGMYSLDIAPQNSGEVAIAKALTAAPNGETYDLTIAGTGVTASIQDTQLTSIGTATLTDASWTNVTVDSGDYTLDGGTYDRCTWNGANGVTVDTDVTMTGCTVQNTTDGIRATTPGDYSAVEAALSDNTTDLTIDPTGPGTFTFSGLSHTGTLAIHNASATHAITVELASGQAYSTTTAGGTVTVVSAPVTLTVTGLVDGCEVNIYDLDEPDPENDMGTRLGGDDPLSGTEFELSNSKPQGDAGIIQVLAAGYVEALVPFTFAGRDQEVPVILELDPNL